jgi:small subunit ribosomal protein S6
MEEVKLVAERSYETMFILKPDMEDEARNEIIEKFKTIITDNNGEVLNVDEWGNRKLAYEIRDLRSGYYILINFQGGLDVLNELEHNFKINDSILRHLIVKGDK